MNPKSKADMLKRLRACRDRARQYFRDVESSNLLVQSVGHPGFEADADGSVAAWIEYLTTAIDLVTRGHAIPEIPAMILNSPAEVTERT